MIIWLDLTGDFQCFIIHFETLFTTVLRYRGSTSHSLVRITPRAAWGMHPPWNYAWYEAPTHTGDTPWLKIMINEVITLVKWFLYILQTRKSFLLTSAKIQNYTIKEHLLSRGPTGEIFKLISPLDPKIWHHPCFS